MGIIRKERRIGIIGAGFTGTLLAVHLMRLAKVPTHLFLVERRGNFGRGLAYSTGNEAHLLNVRVANMSAWPDDPKHFLRWLWALDDPRTPAEAIPPSGHAFVSRGLYGSYVQEQFAEAVREAAAHATAHVTCSTLSDDVVDLRRKADGGFVLRLACASEIEVDDVALCIGNFPPALPGGVCKESADSRFYIGDPWNVRAIAEIPRDAPVLVLGTGLTTADMVISLQENGHRGPITALSRRGLLPAIHKEARSYPSYIEDGTEPLRMLELMRRVRAEVRRGTAAGYDWRSILDALRPHLRRLWGRLPEAERRRFLRHVRPYWDVHRHRMAPEVARVLEKLRAEGRLTVQRGRLRALLPGSAGLVPVVTPRGSGVRQELPPSWVINCSGPDCDYARIAHPLVRSLLDSGLARPDALGLGLDVTGDAVVIGADGQATEGLYALGPVTRGTFWEITAVPELRVQCAEIARQLQTWDQRAEL